MKTPWGNARATLRLRGVDLPPRGSVAERVLIEMLERERWQALATWELSMMATGLFRGMKPEFIQRVIGILREDLTKHLFHTMYDQRVYTQRIKQELSEIQAEKRRLARLDSMTI